MARLTRNIAYALLPFTLLSGRVTADDQTPLALKPNAPTTYTVVKVTPCGIFPLCISTVHGYGQDFSK